MVQETEIKLDRYSLPKDGSFVEFMVKGEWITGYFTEGDEEYIFTKGTEDVGEPFFAWVNVEKWKYKNATDQPSEPSSIPVVDGNDICEGCGKTFSWNPPIHDMPGEPVVCSCYCYDKVSKNVVDYEKDSMYFETKIENIIYYIVESWGNAMVPMSEYIKRIVEVARQMSSPSDTAVIPLKWEYVTGFERWQANTPFGLYTITEKPWEGMDMNVFWMEGPGRTPCTFDDLDKAKNHTQIEYTNQVLKQIRITTSDTNCKEVLNELLDWMYHYSLEKITVQELFDKTKEKANSIIPQ